MLVSDKLGLIFIHVPKTGGQAVGAALRESADDIRPFRAFHNYHLAASIGKSKVDWNNYTSFAFVRNPWERMVSAYAYGTSHKVKFDDFVKGTLDFMQSPRWILTKPQVYWLYDENGNCLVNMIGRYERFAEDFALICPTAPPLKRVNVSDHLPYREYYNDMTRQIVATRFADDICEFGYSFE